MRSYSKGQLLQLYQCKKTVKVDGHSPSTPTFFRVLLLTGINLYGKNWNKIHLIVPSRSRSQIRSHAQKFFIRLQKEYSAKLKTEGRSLSKRQVRKALNDLVENPERLMQSQFMLKHWNSQQNYRTDPDQVTGEHSVREKSKILMFYLENKGKLIPKKERNQRPSVRKGSFSLVVDDQESTQRLLKLRQASRSP